MEPRYDPVSILLETPFSRWKDEDKNQVLHKIFLCLKVPDRLNAALVCKNWLEVMNSKSLLRDIRVLIHDNNTVPLFVQSSRNFMNFKFKMIIVDRVHYSGLFERISSMVEYLSFEHCEIWKREPVKFDLNYDKLEVLESLHCDLWSLFPSVPNLTELYLSGDSTITDKDLAVLQKTMKNLKTLKLDCCISYEKVAYKRFYVGTTYETTPSDLVLSLPAITSFITERAVTLKELRIFSSITKKALRQILSIKNLSLHTLEFSTTETRNSFLSLLKNHPLLKVLKLRGAYSLTNDDIIAICTLLPDIEELYVDDGADITTLSFNAVFHLPRLKKLKFGGRNCYSERNHGLLSTPVKHLPLSYLDISGSNFKCIELLINLCSNLVHLNLSGCRIKDYMVHLISTQLVKLQHLYLNSTSISDYGLTGVKPDTDDRLGIFGTDCSYISPMPISNLEHLTYLKLNECKKITKFGLRGAIHFQHLEYLNVCGCDVDELTLEILIQQNPSIRKIFCEGSLQILGINLKRSKKVAVKKDFNDDLETICWEKSPLNRIRADSDESYDFFNMY